MDAKQDPLGPDASNWDENLEWGLAIPSPGPKLKGLWTRSLAMMARPKTAGLDSVEIAAMSRVCHFTGRSTRSGRSIARRGKAKKHGGVGKNITGVSKRTFKPNIQTVRAVVDGRVCRIKVSAKAIRMGLVIKPARRQYKAAKEKAAE